MEQAPRTLALPIRIRPQRQRQIQQQIPALLLRAALQGLPTLPLIQVPTL